eukprot:IDg702t1
MAVQLPVFRLGRRIPTTVLAGTVASDSVDGKHSASPQTTGTISIPSARTTTVYSYLRYRLTRVVIGAGISMSFFEIVYRYENRLPYGSTERQDLSQRRWRFNASVPES